MQPDAVVQAPGAVEPVGFGAHSNRLLAATVDRQSRQQPQPKPTVAALTDGVDLLIRDSEVAAEE